MRLIDADALIVEIKTCLWDWESVNGIMAKTVLNQTITDIGNMPIIDAVPVVRCRDCRYRKTYICPLQESEFNEWECDFEYYDHTEDDGYCYKGEKKDDGDNH